MPGGVAKLPRHNRQGDPGLWRWNLTRPEDQDTIAPGLWLLLDADPGDDLSEFFLALKDSMEAHKQLPGVLRPCPLAELHFLFLLLHEADFLDGRMEA